MLSFFKAITPNNQGEILNNEYLRIFIKRHDGKVENKYFRDIDNAVRFIKADEKQYPTSDYYFGLSTTDGKGCQSENQRTRKVIALDFDNKDFGKQLQKRDIERIYNRIGLKYHIIVSSGNGLHVYTILQNTTSDLESIKRLSECLADKTGADKGAVLNTQLLRVPGTHNNKDKDNPKKVEILFRYGQDKIKPQNLERMTRQQITGKYLMEKEQGLIGASIGLKADKIYPCVQSLIINGTTKGDRQNGLIKLVVNLRNNGLTLEEVEQQALRYNDNCIPPMNKDELIYQTGYIYNYVYTADYGCKFCKLDTKQYCFNSCTDTEFKFLEDDRSERLQLSNKAMKNITKPKKKGRGVPTMQGNDLIVYCLLVYNKVSISVNGLLRELEYRGNKTISEKTLRSSLKSLEEQKLIEVSGNKIKYYQAKPMRTKEEYKFLLSTAALYECIKGFISPQEFRLYGYMRYKLNEQRAKGILKSGNILILEQEEMAKDLGIDRSVISKQIQNLVDEKIISLYDYKKSKCSEFYYNSYRLNY